jgi:hypothetical protein
MKTLIIIPTYREALTSVIPNGRGMLTEDRGCGDRALRRSSPDNTGGGDW